jgi:hypothetical protein
MREIFYHYNRKETDNLYDLLNKIDWWPVEEFLKETKKLIGLEFPTTNFWDVQGTRSNLYAIGVVTDEKQYLLAKLKYGI